MKPGISKINIGMSLCVAITALCATQAHATKLSQVQVTSTGTQAQTSYSKPVVVKAYKQIRKGNFKEAIDVLAPTVKADPNYVEAHRYLAYSYMHIGRPQDALTSATKAVEGGIEHPHDAVTMGEAQFYTGKPKEAIDSFREALLLNPLHIDARAGVIRCLMALGRFQEAKAICKQAAYGHQDEKGKTYFQKLLREIDSKTQIASTTFGS